MEHCVTKPEVGEAYTIALTVVARCACGCGQTVAASLKSWDMIGNPESSIARGVATRVIAHGVFESLQAFMRGDAGATGCASRDEVDAAVQRMLPSLTGTDLTRDLDAALDTAKQIEKAALELRARSRVVECGEQKLDDDRAALKAERKQLKIERNNLTDAKWALGFFALLAFFAALAARFF